jgi:hypothetical protein
MISVAEDGTLVPETGWTLFSLGPHTCGEKHIAINQTTGEIILVCVDKSTKTAKCYDKNHFVCFHA